MNRFGTQYQPTNPFLAQSGVHRYGFNGMEKESLVVKGAYSAEHWQFDGRIGRRWNIDPILREWEGHYTCLRSNPILWVDPNGDDPSTQVEENNDGTYTVVGGNSNDGDNGIYLRNEDGSNGKLIGYSATPESFYYSEKGTWHGTIDPNDQSGRNFLNDQILTENPSLPYYLFRAYGGQDFDFKRDGTSGPDDPKYDDPNYHYRGMPILKPHNGVPIFASARDVGNIGAGLMAGLAGMSWNNARIGFDGLQSGQESHFTTESSSTQFGQFLGFRIGYAIHYNSGGYRKDLSTGNWPGQGHSPKVKKMMIPDSFLTRRQFNSKELPAAR